LRLRRHLRGPALARAPRAPDRRQPRRQPVPVRAREALGRGVVDHRGGQSLRHDRPQRRRWTHGVAAHPEPVMTGSPLRGRALVTGGTSGIGLAFARALAARGCDLLLVARDPARLEATAEELHRRFGVDVQTMSADLSDCDDTERVAQRLVSDSDPIEVLVNNAGHGLHDPIAQRDLTVHLRALDVMVRAVLVLGGRGAAAMAERGHGVIINVGSVAGLIAQNNYSAIKAWVNTFSDALGLELEGTGVRV